MYFLFIILLILLGLLSASGFVEDKLPQAKKVINFLKPYQEWIGLASILFGFIWIFKIIIHLGVFLKYAAVLTLIRLASNVLLIILGVLFAQTTIRKYAKGNVTISDFINKMVDKFAPMKGQLGLIAIGSGVLNFLLYIT